MRAMQARRGDRPVPMDIPLGARPKPNRAPLLIGVPLLVAAALAVYTGLRAGGVPEIEITLDKPAVGRSGLATVDVREPVRGVVSVELFLVQGERRTSLAQKTFVPQPAWMPWGEKTDAATLASKFGKDHQTDLEEGTAIIEVSASGASSWLSAAPTAVAQREVVVRLTPPPLSVTTREIYVMQGGAELVTYTVGKTAVKDGVQAGKWFFPGYPRPGRETERIAFFSVPYDMGSIDEIVLVAEDDVGNRNTTSFINNFRPKPYETDTINVTDSVMRVVVPKIRARSPELEDHGTLLDNYVGINRNLRKANNDRLVELAKQTQPKLLWSRPFVQMSAKVVSSFADRRTYVYRGKPIDQQDHLGFDLASVRHAEIPAANDGIVVMAEYLGIYGNTVVLDHGLGLMSLYAHCSSIDVKVGDQVTRGQTIARTGSTGLAMGDHLHFTMLLSGLPVTALEWWDGHWIQDRIARKLPDIFKSGED